MQNLIEAIHVDLDKAIEERERLRGLLKEGLKATQLADGHWSDRFRWTNWVIKVEKELADD